MAIEVRPATVFEDVAAVIGPKRADASVCWCLSYRIPAKEAAVLRGTDRGDRVRELVAEDIAPGVLAYDGDDAVGWAAVHPRANTGFARNRKIPHVDDLPVFSIWCIRVRPGHRGEGIMHELIAGAVEHARRSGAPALEAYPVQNDGQKVDSTMLYVGTQAMYERAGFHYVMPTTSVINGFPRVLMRYTFDE